MIVTAVAVGNDEHSSLLLTINVYVPAASPVNVVVVPVPLFTDPPVAVTIHVPVAGSPVNTTLPVATVQVGCVIVPTEGAPGVEGCALIVTDVAALKQPAALLTVRL